MKRSRLLAAAAAAGLAAAMLDIVAVLPAGADHSPTTSTGVYRIPYADGTSVGVNNDAHNHNDAYDMSAGEDSSVVAAASGWIRAAVDHHGEEPNPGDGEDINEDPQDDSLEHACGNNDPANTVVGGCGAYNNYVWIEHPNGEWTKYTHLGTGTVDDNGWSVGDWINAGQEIGLENDIGAASTSGGQPGDRAFHLHFEVAIPDDPNDMTPFCEAGGFMISGCADDAGNTGPFGDRVAAVVCDIPDNDLLAGTTYTANPCDHQPPTADAGGPYVVDEGSAVRLDATGSTDPDGNPLTYAWLPVANLDDSTLAEPFYTGVDDGVFLLVLTVYDQIEALPAQAFAGVTVNNVVPAVSAVGGIASEGEAASIQVAFTDPGVQDAHTATIDWGDGGGPQGIDIADLTSGPEHVYGDNGVYDVTVTVTDDDGGVGSDTTQVGVANVPPTVDLDLGGVVSFPGGDHFVVGSGGDLPAAADGADPGSDDLTFTWISGEANTYFNNGIGPDPLPSPGGTFPFAASDAVDVGFADPGAETLVVTLTDDDGGSDIANAGVIVVGTAEGTKGRGWWKHQYSGKGKPNLDEGLAAGYLASVTAASSVFSEEVALTSAAQAHDVLSPTGPDRRTHTTAALLLAWLHFASGAVSWEADVPLGDGSTVAFLDLMAAAEAAVLDEATTDAELVDIEQDLARVRHAG